MLVIKTWYLSHTVRIVGFQKILKAVQFLKMKQWLMIPTELKVLMCIVCILCVYVHMCAVPLEAE